MSKLRGGGGGGPGADLKRWCGKMTEGYPGVSIANFHTSWRDGLAFCALVHKHAPEALNFESLDAANVLSNNQLAFDMAHKYFGVPKLLDAEDMLMTKPEAVAEKGRPMVPANGATPASPVQTGNATLASPRGAVARPAQPQFTVRPAQPSTPTQPAIPASELLRQQAPQAVPAAQQTPLAGSTGRARRVSLVIQPNQIPGIMGQGAVLPLPLQVQTTNQANKRRSGAWNISPSDIAAAGAGTEPAKPTGIVALETAMTRREKRGTINLGTEVLALPSFMRNRQPEQPAEPQPEPTRPEKPAPVATLEPEEEGDDDDQEIAMTSAVKNLISVYADKTKKSEQLEAAIQELDKAHQQFQDNGRSAANTCSEDDKDILFPAFDGVTEIVDDLKKEIRGGKPTAQELQHMCNDVLTIINDEIMAVLLGGDLGLDFDDEDIDFSELEQTPVPDVEFLEAEEMEERLNEALDLIDELTQQLDEQTDELTMAKDTATELEAKAAAQDKELEKLHKALKERDDEIAMLKKSLKEKDDQLAKSKECSARSAELQKKLDEALAHSKKADRNKKESMKLATEYKNKLDQIQAIINNK